MGFLLAVFISFSRLLAVPGIEEDYDKLYVFHSPDRSIEQKLYVRFTGRNEIGYKLLVTREDCENELEGIAKSSGGDGEIDEDADGNAYMAVEYRFENPDYYLGIRISEDKKKVKLAYAPNIDGKERCPVVANELMYSE
ncbi:MAG: hypothetical protein K0R65_1975 [Crocinitomicaceae bacterium]|jgi:hypothetical protein|nr:hypothetical protein [Crocinitomicaceae bacterium]